MRFALTLAAVVLIPASLGTPLAAAWPSDGVLACGAAQWQSKPRIVSDLAGGMIVAWEDERDSDPDVYAQRLDGSGHALWAADGILLSTKDHEFLVDLVPDGAGGAIAVWFNLTKGQLIAYRLDPNGSHLWGQTGIVVSATDPTNIVAESDGSGGVLLAWTSMPGIDLLLMVQHLDGNGNELWPSGPSGGLQVSPNPVFDSPASIVSDGAGGVLVAFIKDNPELVVEAARIYASSASWSAVLSTQPGSNSNPTIAPDGTGGAFVAWQSGNTSTSNIFARRIDGGGTVQWSQEAYVCIAPGAQRFPDIMSDGVGGVYIAWDDTRNADQDIYAQRLDAFGIGLWTADGLPICMSINDQYQPRLLAHDPLNPIVVWPDLRSAGSLYAQRFDGGGATAWAANGVKVLDGLLGPGDYDFAADGSGGLLSTLNDDRLAAYADVYAQSINSFGDTASAEPRITGITDVPGDQGGFVRIAIGPSDRDRLKQISEQVTLYDVWQRIDDPAMVSKIVTIAGGSTSATAREYFADSGDRFFLLDGSKRYALGTAAFPPGAWELVGSFGASQAADYTFRASTLADSTTAGISYSVYAVVARTTNPSVWFVSDPDSGYSVDNIPPGVPKGLTAALVGSVVTLTWDAAPEPDFQFFRVYRDINPAFVPAPGNLLHETAETTFQDSPSDPANVYYKITAVDHAGNESGPTPSTEVVGIGGPQTPTAYALRPGVPNPLRSATRITFDLPWEAPVSLDVFDPAGRRVRSLLRETRPAGTHTVEWDGKDGSGRLVSAGVYLYRLQAGAFEAARRIVVIR